MGVRENSEMTRKAKVVMELFEGEPLGMLERVLPLLQEKIASMNGKPKPRKLKTQTPKLKPMTYNQAVLFEKEKMPARYSAYKNHVVKFVPPWYIVAVTTEDSFSQDLKRYTMSKRFQERQDKEE